MKRVVTFGEIMLRLAAPGYERLLQTPRLEATFGGSEANVAIGLAYFGIPAAFATVLPHGHPLTEACLGELRRHNVDTSAVAFGPGRFGTYYLEAGANQRPPRVVYDREGSAIARSLPGALNWVRIFEGAGWFHISEITPALSATAADLTFEAVKAARALGLKVSCDLNHRKNLWKWGADANEVMPDLAAVSDVVIGNRETMDVVLGVQSGGSHQDLAADVFQRYPNLSALALTRRESRSASHNDWSACLYDGSRFVECATYAITHIVDRIGGGDAFSAGLIYGMLRHEDLHDALSFAGASAALKHSIPGDFSRSTVEEVEALRKGDKSGKIQR